ncbi:cell wall hydrolase [Methylobacterium sp. Leaf117]|uniref:cell wall hydrolase n=1 Tax=Methylobacterium sp. Leaf117 TaxID=1736260 RepID=UPI0006F53296|nr:cell wall hydrolase [Methylobacterium sp. Leaf117]KQP91736.1 cell wall hydrolase [Methylobacterium sp. Leaf117]
MTPWAAGVGLLVSFTATAGTDMAPGIAGSLAPSARLLATASPGARLSGTETRTHPARRTVSRATFDRPGETDSEAILVRASLTEMSGGLLPPGNAGPSLDVDAGFVPTPDLGRVRSTEVEGSVVVVDDGATPAIPRAEALSSTTPAPADATPIEIAAASLVFPGLSPRAGQTDGGTSIPETPPDVARHRYADLIGADAKDREQRCLAEAVYFEARSESEEGQAAVAQVVLNRVKSGLYPGNVCGVVYQNRHRYMGCQFSFACEGKSLRITDDGSWQTASRIASAVIDGRTYLDEVGGATHYHADYVRPGWSRRLKKMDVIGRHIFYQLKRGQT